MAIGFFPHPGRKLPHPAIQPRLLRLIRDAIAKAWELMVTKPPPGFNLSSANEVQVNTVLYATLVNQVLADGIVKGFDTNLFRISPTPGLRTFDGASLEKRPDIFIHLLQTRASAFPDVDGLFAECKPVDDAHEVGAKYCDLGLWRFVKGEYAWAMTEGMMVGYAVTGYALPWSLSNCLVTATRSARMPLTSGPTPIGRAKATAYAQVPHTTVHRRNFKYVETGKAAPDITIHHLWLNRN